MDKICEIPVDILDLKGGFSFVNFFIRSDFFPSKTIKIRIGSYFFFVEKSSWPMRIQQKVASYEKICKWKTSLVSQANRSKVVYLSADRNVGPFKDQFPLACWILHNVTKLFKWYDWLICFVCLHSDRLQYNSEILVYMFFKTNYIWILLWYVTFHVQVEIDLYVMPPTLESFNRPLLRLWFYAALIQIEFGSSMWRYLSYGLRRKSCVLLTFGFNIKRNNIKEKKEVLEVLIHLS